MNEKLLKSVTWRRTYLFLECEGAEELLLVEERSGRCFAAERLESGIFQLNLCIADGREMLPRGSYRIVDGGSGEEISVLPELAVRYEELGRIFRYSEKKYAYTVSFSVREEPGGMYLGMDAEYYGRIRNPYRRHPLIEASTPVKWLKKIISYGGRNCAGIYYRILAALCPKRGKKVLFLSENREFLSENLAALDRRLRERGGDYQITYSLRNIFAKKYSVFSWLRLVARIAAQDYIFVDDYVPIFGILPLSKKTTLVQCWHAGFGFKLVGYGRFGIGGSPHPYLSCHRKYDYGIIGCESLKEIYSEVWGIPQHALIPAGMPRLDHFLDEDVMASAKADFAEKYPAAAGRKVVLFAPTYRGMDQKSAHYDFSKVDFAAFYAFACEKDAVVLFKMHHFITEPVPIPGEYADRLIEVRNMGINDLFYSTDVLITDYSSCFYDFSILKKPMLFYVYDEALYTATRGVHRPLEEVAPGKLCHDFEALITALREEDYEEERREGFFVDRCAERGRLASDIVLDAVLKKA